MNPLIAVFGLSIIAVASAVDTFAQVKSCQSSALQTCISACVSAVPSANQAAVGACITSASSAIPSIQSSVSSCLSSNGISDSTPCFKVEKDHSGAEHMSEGGAHQQGEGHGEGHAQGGARPSGSSASGANANLVAFGRCSMQCIHPKSGNSCVSSCPAATTAQEDAIKTCMSSSMQSQSTSGSPFASLKTCLQSAFA